MAMEVYNGIVMRSRPLFNSGGAGIDHLHHNRVSVGGLSRIPSESRLRWRSTRRRVVGAFEEKEHAEYYNRCAAPDCGEEGKEVGWNRVSEKKRAKLLKELAKNLSMFSELGFGLETDKAMDKGIQEAAMVLQSHLEHLRAQGEKLKVRRKQSVKEGSGCSSSSESSSSESSDSELDNDQVAVRQQLVEEEEEEEEEGESMSSEPHETMTADSPQVGEVGVMVHNAEDTSGQLKRVEVCMGGKCKKMGAQLLVDEFHRVLGGSVVDCCKCMGKCKTAPNVRIFSADADADADGDANADSVGSPNPLYLGVGLEDVGLIAAYYLRSDQASLGVLASPLMRP